MAVIEVGHPLVRYKLALMRRQNISTKESRELASEVARLLTYEATKDLETERHTIRGNGQVALILDIPQLIQRAEQVA